MTAHQLTIEQIERGLHGQHLEQATFGMGCFWGPEARFGALPGVIRTRVGYAGGTIESPTYRTLGDHTETVQIEFDPAAISYEDVLRQFWRNHYPNRDQYKGRQYISLLFYHNTLQKSAIDKVKHDMELERGELIETEIVPFTQFTFAEERHQKYYLKRYPHAMAQLSDLFPTEQMLMKSTFAARLNGFVRGHVTRDTLIEEISTWHIAEHFQHLLIDQLRQMKW